MYSNMNPTRINYIQGLTGFLLTIVEILWSLRESSFKSVVFRHPRVADRAVTPLAIAVKVLVVRASLQVCCASYVGYYETRFTTAKD